MEPPQQVTTLSVLLFGVITVGLFCAVSVSYIIPRRAEITKNWGKYKDNPLFLFGAFFFKPDGDPRSNLQFGQDNFMEVMDSLSTKIFMVFLQPVFELFKLFTNTIMSVLNNIFAFRDLLKTMFAAFLRIFEPFMARFRTISHQLRMTFLHLKDAIGRVAAVSTAAIFAGISTIRTMLNLFELMKIVIGAIIITLVILTIFFWFVLWPVVPLIVAAIAIIVAAGGGSTLGDAASAFCFAGGTLVEHEDGSTTPIESTMIGTKIKGGGIVEATMIFETQAHPFYLYKGVVVSGSHIVYEPTPELVQDSKYAIPMGTSPARYYCLQTSSRRISVRTPMGNSVEFADWEELEEEDESSLIAWHQMVEKTLNRCIMTVRYPKELLNSEALLSPSTLLQTSSGLCAISTIQPGMLVLNADGISVKVLGVVQMESSNVEQVQSVGKGMMSCSCWVRPPGIQLWRSLHTYARAFPLSPQTSTASDIWYNLFTEDGTFLLGSGWAVRDFTDVGPDYLVDTHSETLRILKERTKVE